MTNYIKRVEKADTHKTTLNELLVQLKAENGYIKRIRQDQHSIVIETGYNLSAETNKKL